MVKEKVKIEKPEKLKGVIQLIKESWEMYYSNLRTILYIMLVPLAFFILQSIISYAFVLIASGQNNISIVAVTILSITLSLVYGVLTLLTTVAMILSIKDDLSAKEAYSRGISLFFSYLWVIVLNTLIILGGLVLLIIPGLIFIVWFMFSQYALIFEEKKGFQALKRSKELVKGRFIDVIYRVVVFTVFMIPVYFIISFSVGLIGLLISIAIGLINEAAFDTALVGLEAASALLDASLEWFFFTPFAVLYWIHIYDNLVKVKQTSRKEGGR